MDMVCVMPISTSPERGDQIHGANLSVVRHGSHATRRIFPVFSIELKKSKEGRIVVVIFDPAH